jgi:chemotaxis signal transduction protein
VELVLIGRIGPQRFGVPIASVERILPMAALTPLPEAAPLVAGILNYHGAVLPVVDPRPRLNTPPVRPHADQHLVIVLAQTRYLLWMDQVERILPVAPHQLDRVVNGDPGALVPGLLRLEEGTIPLLSVAALDPGPVIQTAREFGRV